MFEKDLKEKFKRIFAVKKVTFDDPGKAREQECIFINVQKARNTIKDGRQISLVRGIGTIYGGSEKLPFGYLSQRIAKAKPEDTKDLFFEDIEENEPQYRDIVQRSFNFVYFFSGQYDPNIGSIDGTIITEET